MKRLVYLLLLCSVSGWSCKKFLTSEPKDFMAPEFYYNTESNLLSALAGVYQPLSTAPVYGDAMFNQLGAGTDESFRSAASSTTGVWVYNYDYSNPDINNLWSQLYKGVERANLLIANINLAPLDEVKRNAILGEAKFLRGYYYFLLVSNWGDVPLRTEPIASAKEISFPRASSTAVYAQILKDMTEAEGLVFPITQFGYSSRVGKTTVQSILARVCLTMAGFPLKDESKYAEALKWATEVKKSGVHSLLTEAIKPDGDNNSGFSQVFVNETAEKYDIREVMWEAEQKGNRTDGYTSNGRLGNDIGIGFTAPNYVDSGYCYGNIRITERLFNLYKTGDLRKNWACAPFSYGTTAPGARTYFPANQIYNRAAAKWRRTYEPAGVKDKNYTGTNFPIIRYADVLLMLAEAENKVHGPTDVAYDAINQVRRRGYGKPLTVANTTTDLTPGLGPDAFQQALQDERSRELCFETLRRPDLIRWGIFVKTMNDVGEEFRVYNGTYKYGALAGTNVTKKHLVFPIPSSELSVNKAASQNEGW